MRRIFMNNEERIETQQSVNIHFQAPCMLVKKFSRPFSSHSKPSCFPKQKLAFKIFVQRRWVYSVAELISEANVMK